ncbi:MAG: Holliday junction resolvase RuvX [Desulfomonilia bacterium]
MAIDYGKKRMGIAISDPGCTMAHPLDTIAVRPDGSHMVQIQKVVTEYEVGKVVVGLPYNMDGSVSEIGKEVITWAHDLETMLSLPVELFDERLTSFEAHELLISHQVKGRKRRKVVDKIAASLILREYLNMYTP